MGNYATKEQLATLQTQISKETISRVQGDSDEFKQLATLQTQISKYATNEQLQTQKQALADMSERMGFVEREIGSLPACNKSFFKSSVTEVMRAQHPCEEDVPECACFTSDYHYRRHEGTVEGTYNPDVRRKSDCPAPNVWAYKNQEVLQADVANGFTDETDVLVVSGQIMARFSNVDVDTMIQNTSTCYASLNQCFLRETDDGKIEVARSADDGYEPCKEVVSEDKFRETLTNLFSPSAAHVFDPKNGWVFKAFLKLQTDYLKGGTCFGDPEEDCGRHGPSQCEYSSRCTWTPYTSIHASLAQLNNSMNT